MARRRAGKNAGSTPFGVTVTFASGTPYSSTTSRFVRSETASTWSARRAARGTTDLNVEPVEPPHRRRRRARTRGRAAVTTDAAAAAERQRVLEVRELGPEAPQQPRQRPRHPQLLRAGRAASIGSTPGGHELGAPRHGREAEVGRGAPAARAAGSSRTSRRRCAARPSTSASIRITRPPRRPPASRARDLGPRRDRAAAAGRNARAMPVADRVDVASGRRTSRRRRRTRPSRCRALVTTGQPQASASATGIPKPS